MKSKGRKLTWREWFYTLSPNLPMNFRVLTKSLGYASVYYYYYYYYLVCLFYFPFRRFEFLGLASVSVVNDRAIRHAKGNTL